MAPSKRISTLGGIAVVASHVALKTKFANTLALGKERVS